eukprot:CAMPEP_0181291650 /NCGR_PEP_ID=MMETSP1101-20121128/2081_1 /TAXON_ID=46948 /ORGANISM="Rhodomonas abbreviata, Strain Caron Lab Isolate" /LENGTH=68 /DNA_ID=CAMNT_0023396057 /DNA_START=109 /DNA_END=315 /DNA_ORIENTATION=-
MTLSSASPSQKEIHRIERSILCNGTGNMGAPQPFLQACGELQAESVPSIGEQHRSDGIDAQGPKLGCR